MKSCKECGQRIGRAHRRIRMRFLPLSRHYRCGQCSTEYLKVLGMTIRIAPPIAKR